MSKRQRQNSQDSLPSETSLPQEPFVDEAVIEHYLDESSDQDGEDLFGDDMDQYFILVFLNF